MEYQEKVFTQDNDGVLRQMSIEEAKEIQAKRKQKEEKYNNFANKIIELARTENLTISELKCCLRKTEYLVNEIASDVRV